MTFETQLAAFASRYGWSLERARAEAERPIANAVGKALVGAPRFDLLPAELEDEARLRWTRRVQAGEAKGVEHLSGTSGLPLTTTKE